MAGKSTARERSLNGKRIAFTGRLLSMSRDDARNAVEDAGGVPASTVSRRTALLVVGMGGWPILANGKVSNSLLRAEELKSRGANINIVSEEVFLEQVGLKERAPALEKQYTTEEICGLAGIEPHKLRRWEQLGLLRSENGRFDFQDLISLRSLIELIGRGVRPELINQSLRSLARVLPNTDRPRAQLQIVVDNAKSLVAELDGCLITSEGQFLLRFDRPSPAPESTLEFVITETDESESTFERAQRLEDEEQYEAAAADYRQAIVEDPGTAETYFNLGNVLRGLNRHDAALEMYVLAVSFDAGLCEAWYNIADIHEESGRFEASIESLTRAIDAEPSFADAYYNLALCFEKTGKRRRARRCWSDYLKLDPASEWAEIARTHLAATTL